MVAVTMEVAGMVAVTMEVAGMVADTATPIGTRMGVSTTMAAATKGIPSSHSSSSRRRRRIRSHLDTRAIQMAP